MVHIKITPPTSLTISSQHSTPKYCLLIWLATQDKLSTCDRVANWNTDNNRSCVLCNVAGEQGITYFSHAATPNRFGHILLKVH
ncbi:hypothetical protein Bca4012_072592 [Brassica carinata]